MGEEKVTDPRYPIPIYVTRSRLLTWRLLRSEARERKDTAAVLRPEWWRAVRGKGMGEMCLG